MSATGHYLLDRRVAHGPKWYETRRQPILAICEHITAGLEDLDATDDHSAEKTAAYAATTDRKVSWHEGTDADSNVSLLPDTYTAFHVAGYNCLAPDHLVLADDFRWVPAGDLAVGDGLLAFDEEGAPGKGRGRDLAYARVVNNDPDAEECYRVILGDGSEIIATADHPWLATVNGPTGGNLGWRTTRQLLAKTDQRFVHKALEPWSTPDTWEAGWMSGFMDGEGCLNASSSRGRPAGHRLSWSQVPGPVLDQSVEIAERHKFDLHLATTPKRSTTQVGVRGGFGEQLRFLGTFHPQRLVRNLSMLRLPSLRALHAEYVQVLAVEPVGKREITRLGTTSGTFFADGFSMHNSCTLGREISKRHTDWRSMPAHWTRATLANAAVGDARWCRRWGIPVRKATRAELDQAIAHYRATGQARPVGFIGHTELDPTRRSDPGKVRSVDTFPWHSYLELVHHHVYGSPLEDDDMPPPTLAWLREKPGQNAPAHCYRIDGGVASWQPTPAHIGATHFLGAVWWGGSEREAFVDPVLWEGLTISNGPLANLRVRRAS